MSLQYHFFSIPALHPQQAQDELNRFCAAHRVVTVERQFIAAGTDSHWALCVAVAGGPGKLPDALKAAERRTGTGDASASTRVDYKQVLGEADFALYAELRQWRKTAAEQAGVPVYAVFTNEQLAEIVTREVGTLAGLGAIDGIGPARLERYGADVLARLQAARLALAPADPDACSATR